MSDIYGRPSAPIEEPETIFVEEVLLCSAHGVFIPKFFTQSIKRPDYVPEWAWENCLKGPGAFEDQADYWDSWSEILDTFQYEKTGPGGSTERYFLDYEEGDLCLMREIVEPPDYNDE
jgi:hypothetical protein